MILVCHASYVAPANAGDQAKSRRARRYAQGDDDITIGVSSDQLG